jgi:hypothetical protein
MNFLSSSSLVLFKILHLHKLRPATSVHALMAIFSATIHPRPLRKMFGIVEFGPGLGSLFLSIRSIKNIQLIYVETITSVNY